MAVAAYASLLSLTHLLDNLHYRAPFHLPLLDINLAQTLQQSVHSLLEFVETHHLESETPEIVDLWRRLAKISFETEEMVDSHVVNLLYLRSLGQTSIADISSFCDDLQRMITKFDIIKKDLPEIHEACIEPAAAFDTTVVAPTATSSSGKRVVVGFDDHVVHIMDKLTFNKGKLQILSIVGMGGIGKTTLAKCVYDHPHIVNCFDRRIWVTISQEFDLKQILVTLLATERTHESSTDVLGGRLHKELFGRKYLIIMDDMWSTEAWDDLRRYFPDNENGSRILVTTRDTNVASRLGSLNHYPLSFLDGDTSWDLFCLTAFAQRGCPFAELEKVGRELVQSCRGLPLEISVIGRLLANSVMTQEYWRLVAKNISSFGNLEDNEHCLKILSLSYKSLPIHLKPCFLYLRVFPEDANISSRLLINKWVAEGFIKPSSDKTLEEVAEQYVEVLISRSLMFKREDHDNDATYGVHDLIRDLCARESNKEHFILSPKHIEMKYLSGKGVHCSLCGAVLKRINDASSVSKNCLCFPPSSPDDSHAAVSCDACNRKYSHITKMRLVSAVTTEYGDRPRKFPTEVRLLFFELYNCFHFVFHQLVHLLWKLEICDISLPVGTMFLSSEIWEMPKLRHLRVNTGAYLANPIAAEKNNFIILKDLQTLELIRNFKCTEEVVGRIPNLKYLSMLNDIGKSIDRSMTQPHYSLCNIAQLHKLESLSIRYAMEKITFPDSLKELRLRDCKIAWEDMSIIGSLPGLEILELHSGIEGSEWNPVEGEFVRLRMLKITNTHLKCWGADSIHFPALEKLELWVLKSLGAIPSSIGDIPTLQLIQVVLCSESARKCAAQIREEQQELGNETLNVSL